LGRFIGILPVIEFWILDVALAKWQLPWTANVMRWFV
jgi:hypothetical protein